MPLLKEYGPSRNMPCIPSTMKRTILRYHTGTLFNQKHVAHFKISTNLLHPLPGCHQLDNALHMLSGCQNHITSSIKTERHNIAGRMIIELLRRLLSTLIAKIRHGLLLVTLLIPIDFFHVSLGEEDTWCLGPRYPLFLN
eukprot:1145721-Pelagomonas_calceolata.AAC.2